MKASIKFQIFFFLMTIVTALDIQARSEIDLTGNGWKLWLDHDAEYGNDVLHLPPIDIMTLPVHPPTIGWNQLYESGIEITVPSTVESWYWDTISDAVVAASDFRKKERKKWATQDGDYRGVSWWFRKIDIPANAKGKVLRLKFEANRFRSEIFINNKLVGYDVIHNTPFEVDISKHVNYGEINQLAVRITDAHGNFAWTDHFTLEWGPQRVTESHGFGGIVGPVSLLLVDPVYVENIFVKNKPEITEIDLEITIANHNSQAVNATVNLAITPVEGKEPIYDSPDYKLTIEPGKNVITRTISAPDAKLWHYDTPNLHYCTVSMKAGNSVDRNQVRFGFRWFDIVRSDDKHFVLNGEREFLLTAISWGYWPVTGMTPTRELAEKQIESAKSLNMNMLNFHRHMGQNMLLDVADEKGLLYLAEPGGYAAPKGDSFARGLAREKLLRMVKNFRNHPSLIIYNMINEEREAPTEQQKLDQRDAHKLDPTRIITYSSGWFKKNEPDPVKLHMLPYDDKQYIYGWWNNHHACGLGVYCDEDYNAPSNWSRQYYDDSMREEIIYLGEEGAVGAPPQLEKVLSSFEEYGRKGWDGSDYQRWSDGWESYLSRKNLPFTLAQITTAIGNTQYHYHGRMIENAKINGHVDAYTINGWEGQKLENHSGIVDIFRNFKGDPEELRRYTAPQYVAIKARSKGGQLPCDIVTDFYLVNEDHLEGQFTLQVNLIAPNNQIIDSQNWSVTIFDNTDIGALIKEAATFSLKDQVGHYTIEARLVDLDGKTVAEGMEKLYGLDWKSADIPKRGAILESDSTIKDFLKENFEHEVDHFESTIDKLDYVVMAGSRILVPQSCLYTPDGKPGLKAEYFNGRRNEKNLKLLGTRTEPTIDVAFDPGAKASFLGLGGPDRRGAFTIRWTGTIRPTVTGNYTIYFESDDGLECTIDGKKVIHGWRGGNVTLVQTEPMLLEAGKSYDLMVEHIQVGCNNSAQMLWGLYGDTRTDDLLRRVEEDGTTLIVMAETFAFAEALDKSILQTDGIIEMRKFWHGGGFFVKEHPLFKGLPVNREMNWEYQDLMLYEQSKRYGIKIYGDNVETVAFGTDGHQFHPGDLVAVVSHGKGNIILSTLDMYKWLSDDDASADAVKKIFCNYLEYAKD
jgi:hypothetical protein